MNLQPETALRLFAIRDLVTTRLIPNLFFSSKPPAKVKRDELNHAHKTLHCVTYGPDHRHFTR